MANGKTRLELTWIGKENRPRLEPRILIQDPERSYHAARRVSEDDRFDNRLIFGDNLLALKALESEFVGRVSCIFIDPPYNTGSALEHYNDGLEHSLWLGLMRDRLEVLSRLLSPEGSIWITIDDNEAHYLKVLCDEVFGRQNFVANCVWQKAYSERMDARGFSSGHDHLLVYRRSPAFKVNPLRKDQNLGQFSFFDQAACKDYRRRSLRKEGSESLRADRPSMWYPIEVPDGTRVWPIKPDGTEGRWRWKSENVRARIELLEFVRTANGWEIYVKQYAAESATRPPSTVWLASEVGHNHEAKLEAKALNPNDVFGTPKPERLVLRVLALATNPGDLVLDSFAGSGTTGAVAHKMGRRWIMVELGDHCHTHIIPRLRKVIDGDDTGGVTEQTGWKGGGGFRYYGLAPSLLERDGFGNWVISKKYNKEMLAEAVCKLHGFRYEPSPDVWWQHGRSSERDFLYVTTQTLTAAQLQHLGDEVGPERTLLVCCGAFRGKPPANLTVEKIPRSVLDRCEWGRDDYSLRIASLPAPDAQPTSLESGSDDGLDGERPTARANRARGRRARDAEAEPTLFDLAKDSTGD